VGVCSSPVMDGSRFMSPVLGVGRIWCVVRRQAAYRMRQAFAVDWAGM
jgi:hypothetical protein